jgi:RNA polymerase sigma-70 factor (ECF subfamily)
MMIGTGDAYTWIMRYLSGVNGGKEKGGLDGNLIGKDVVMSCLQGDEVAWETIVHSMAKRVYNLCYRFTGCREEAEDLTQEIFIRIYQTLRTFRSDVGSFQCWAMKLSRNLIIDRYRQSRRVPKSLGSTELEEMHLEDLSKPSPQRRIEQTEASKFVAQALSALSPESQEVINLRYMQGMGYQEMADILKVPEGTVKSRVSRGRQSLARHLARHPAWHEVRTHLPAY